jgi:thioredoxin-related protein
MKVIMYWMRDCKYCDKLKSEIKQLPSEYEKPIMIEYPNIPTIQKAKYGIRLYPTIIFLSDENKMLEKIEGYKPLDEVITTYAKIENLENILQS